MGSTPSGSMSDDSKNTIDDNSNSSKNMDEDNDAGENMIYNSKRGNSIDDDNRDIGQNTDDDKDRGKNIGEDDSNDGGGKSTKASTTPWYRSCRYVLVLMGFLGFANVYAMRVNLSLTIVAMVNHTAVLKQGEISCNANNESSFKVDDGPFTWDENTQSLVLASFYYGYIVTQYPGGRFSELYGAKWVFGLGVAATAVLTLMTVKAATVSTGMLVFLRVTEGLSEGVTIPSMLAMLSVWSKPDERSLMTSLVFSGVKFGTVVALPLSGLLIDARGWESVFYFTGAIGLVWFVAWCFLCYDNPQSHPRISESERSEILTALGKDINGANSAKHSIATPWRSLLTSAPFYAVLTSHACFTYAYYVWLTQMPTYFHNVLHFDIKKNSVVSALPYLVSWVIGILTTLTADWAISRKVTSRTVVRKICNSLATFLPALAMIGAALSGCDSTLAVSMLTLAVGINGAISAGELTAMIDMAPNFAVTVTGLVNVLGSVMGFVAPQVTGAIIQNDSSSISRWQIAFFVVAAVLSAGNVVFLAIGSSEVQAWNEPAPVERRSEEEGEGRPKRRTERVVI